MTSYQFTEGLLVQDKGFRTDADVDSDDPDDLSADSEEDYSPESEESIQGPSTGFSERGPQNADSASASKKDQKDVPQQISEPRPTNIRPPDNKPNPVNYSGTGR